jgi:hypothetical protein
MTSVGTLLGCVAGSDLLLATVMVVRMSEDAAREIREQRRSRIVGILELFPEALLVRGVG